jgi:hypothetical protein
VTPYSLLDEKVTGACSVAEVEVMFVAGSV